MTELITPYVYFITLEYKNIEIILSTGNLNSVKEVKKHIYQIITQKNKKLYINLRRKVIYFSKDFEFNLNFVKGRMNVIRDKIYIAIEKPECNLEYIINLETCEMQKINLKNNSNESDDLNDSDELIFFN